MFGETLSRWLRPMRRDLELWRAGDDPVAQYDVLLRERIATLTELEGSLAGLVETRDRLLNELDGAGATAEWIELDRSIREAEQGLVDFRQAIAELRRVRDAVANGARDEPAPVGDAGPGGAGGPRACVSRWLRPMMADVRSWRAGDDPVAIYDAALRERRGQLGDLEAAVAGIRRARDAARAGLPATAGHLAEIERSLAEAEAGLEAFRREVDALQDQRHEAARER